MIYVNVLSLVFLMKQLIYNKYFIIIHSKEKKVVSFQNNNKKDNIFCHNYLNYNIY